MKTLVILNFVENFREKKTDKEKEGRKEKRKHLIEHNYFIIMYIVVMDSIIYIQYKICLNF